VSGGPGGAEREMILGKREKKKSLETLDLYVGLHFGAAPENHPEDNLVKFINNYGKPDKKAA
jgi:hypothetical protein